MRLAHAQFRRSAAGTALALFLILTLNLLVFSGITAARIVFSLYGLHLGASPGEVGVIVAMLYVVPLLASWPIGALADRHPARWLLAFGTGTGAIGMVLPVFFPRVAALYAASLLLGTALAFITVMGQSLIGSMSTPENRTRNFSNYSLTGSAAIFSGPLLAGFMIDHYGHSPAAAGVALLMFAATTLMVLGGRSLPRSRARPPGRGSNLWETLADRRLRDMLVISSLAQLGSDIFLIFLPVHAHGVGHSASTIGMLISAFAVASFGVRIAMVRLVAWLGERRLLAVAFYGGTLVFVLVPLAKPAALLAALAFLYGLCQGCTQPLTMMLMFSSAEPGRASEAIGLRMTVNNVARLGGPLVFGAMASFTGLLAVFWINGALMGVGGRMSDRPPPAAAPPG